MGQGLVVYCKRDTQVQCQAQNHCQEHVVTRQQRRGREMTRGVHMGAVSTHVDTSGGLNSLSELEKGDSNCIAERSVGSTHQCLTWFRPARISIIVVENTASTFSLSSLKRIEVKMSSHTQDRC